MGTGSASVVTHSRSGLLSRIAVRLALASLVAAIGAIGVVGGLTLLSARSDVRTLVTQEQQQTADTAARAVAAAYRAAGSWATADLSVPATLAAHSQCRLIVLDENGRRLAVPPVPGVTPPRVLRGPLRSARVVVHHARVGTVILHLYRPDYPGAEASLRGSLVRTVGAGAALAVLVALVVSVFVSRRITRPVSVLTDAVRSFETGHRDARVGSDQAGGELGELATAFDRMADNIARQEALRSAMVADIAHELRTPLAILQAWTESLIDGALEVSDATLGSLHEEVLRLIQVVEDFDVLASAEAAKLHIAVRPVDLAAVVEQELVAVQPLFGSAEVDLRTDLVRAAVMADPHRVGQIVSNLLSNALKFTPPGGIVAVTVHRTGDGGVLQVADTGVGIPADELPYVFDRFWRGTGASKLSGSGIGLAVVRTLVEAQGGVVEVASEPQTGSTFTVELPLAASVLLATAGAASARH